jgi:hypothetical protein
MMRLMMLLMIRPHQGPEENAKAEVAGDEHVDDDSEDYSNGGQCFLFALGCKLADERRWLVKMAGAKRAREKSS